jgi:hypothetical protein
LEYAEVPTEGRKIEQDAENSIIPIKPMIITLAEKNVFIFVFITAAGLFRFLFLLNAEHCFHLTFLFYKMLKRNYKIKKNV